MSRGEGAQRWGANMSLTHPPIRHFRPEFYRIHHADSIPEGERFYPHTPWTTAIAPLVSKRGYPGEFSVKASQLKYCEMLERAGMAMANHLDWFISTIWRALDHTQLADVRNFGVGRAPDFTTCSCQPHRPCVRPATGLQRYGTSRRDPRIVCVEQNQ